MKKVKTILIYLVVFISLILLIIILLFGHRDIPVSELTKKYASYPSKFIEVDSMRIHYRDEGNPKDSIPLVLIHGTGASLHTFDQWTQILKEKKRVVRMDLPTFGLTGAFKNKLPTNDNYVTFVRDFLKSKGINQCILAGNSLGGEIAWLFTAKYPQKVTKLILIDAAGYPIDMDSLPLGLKFTRIPIAKDIITYITPKFVVKKSVELAYADKDKLSDSIVNRYFELLLRKGNREAILNLAQIDRDTLYLPLLKQIKQPTLILWGEKDHILDVKNAYRFQKDLPNNKLVIFKDIGHVPMEESPKKSILPVLEFINEK